MYVSHGNDSYFESIYLESEVQDFSDSNQEIIADTPNLAGMDSESKAEPNTFVSHESPLKHLERVADKLRDHLKDTSLGGPRLLLLLQFTKCVPQCLRLPKLELSVSIYARGWTIHLTDK